MALLKEDRTPTYASEKIKIDEDILKNLNHYKDFANFSSIDKLIEKMCAHVMESDKDFKKHLETIKE